MDEGAGHTTSFDSIIHLVDLCYDIFKKALRLTYEQGRYAPFNSVPQRLKTKENDSSGDDECFGLCLVIARVKHSLTSDLWLSNNI